MITLEVRQGCLCDVPSDADGALLVPFGEGKSWCAAVTGTAKKWDRHFWDRPRPRREGLYYVVPAYARCGVVLEFGVNQNSDQVRQLTTDELINMPPAQFTALSQQDQKRRRWYGVIADLTPALLTLAPCKDVAQALALAISYEAEPLLPHLREQIMRMVLNVRGGAISECGYLADILDDVSDPRGKRIREAVREAIDGLFPEFNEVSQEKKSGSLNLKATGQGESQ